MIYWKIHRNYSKHAMNEKKYSDNSILANDVWPWEEVRLCLLPFAYMMEIFHGLRLKLTCSCIIYAPHIPHSESLFILFLWNFLTIWFWYIVHCPANKFGCCFIFSRKWNHEYSWNWFANICISTMSPEGMIEIPYNEYWTLLNRYISL